MSKTPKRITLVAVLDVELDEGCTLQLGEDNGDPNNLVTNFPDWLDAALRDADALHKATFGTPTYRVQDFSVYTRGALIREQAQGRRPLDEFEPLPSKDL